MAEDYVGSRAWVSGGAEHYPTIGARGVLLDVAKLHNVACLPGDHVVTSNELRAAARNQRIELRRAPLCLAFPDDPPFPAAFFRGAALFLK